MKWLNKGTFTKGLLAVAITTAMTGCLDDSDSDDNVTVKPIERESTQTTSFSVNLNNAAPLVAAAGFDWKHPLRTLIPKAYAGTDDLNLENFQIVIVDGDGNVTETIDAEDIVFENLGNGQYELSVPGRPQLNCLIAVNLNEPLVIQTGESIADAGALFTPTTEEELEIDLESTVAFQQFLESVESNAFDEGGIYDVTDPSQVAAVDQILDNVVEALEDLDLEDILSDAGGLDVLLNEISAEDDGSGTVEGSWQEALNNAIETIVEDVIEEEIANIVNATEITIADLIENGGLHWFDTNVSVSFQADNTPVGPVTLPTVTPQIEVEAEYGQVTTSGERLFVYDEEQDEFIAEPDFDAEVMEADGELMLTANGWVNTADAFEVVASSINPDEGSVIIQDMAVSSVQQLISTLQAVDLEGENIADFIGNEGDAEGFALLLDDDGVFSEGATAVKIEISAINDTYTFRYESGIESDGSMVCPYNYLLSSDQLGGNCEVVYLSNPDYSLADESFDESDYTLTGIASSFDEFISEAQGTYDAASGLNTVDGFELSTKEGNIIVELIDTGEADGKLVYFYHWDRVQNDSGFQVPVLAEIELADGEMATWSEVMPEGLNDNESIILIELPDAVQDMAEFGEEGTTIALAVIDGFVRLGHFAMADQVLGDAWVFNAQVVEDALNAFNFMYADAFTVSCYSESEYDDDVFDGLGGPINDSQFTLKAFEIVVDQCGGIDADVTAAVLTANSWYEGQEEVTFNEDFTGRFSEDNDQGEAESYEFTWSINDTAGDGIPNGVIEVVFDETIEEGDSETEYSVTWTEYYAPVGYDEASGQISFKVFSMSSVWYTDETEDGPLPEGTGEIWQNVLTSEPSSNASDSEPSDDASSDLMPLDRVEN